MSEPFLGEIRTFGFSFPPQGWATCDGQLLPISQNTALFSLLGTFYGGNGQTTFGLPDLRGRVPMNSGQGPGLSNHDLGEAGGAEDVTLTTAQMPIHSHPAGASAAQYTSNRPSGHVPARGGAYDTAPDGTALHPQAIGAAGGSQPHPNLQPYLALNFCIALQGIYPSRM